MLVVACLCQLRSADAQNTTPNTTSPNASPSWGIVVQDSRNGPQDNEPLLTMVRSKLEERGFEVVDQATVDESVSRLFVPQTVLGRAHAQRLRAILQADGLVLVSIRTEQNDGPIAYAVQVFTPNGDLIYLEPLTDESTITEQVTSTATQMLNRVERALPSQQAVEASPQAASQQVNRPPKVPRPIDAGSMDYLNVGLAIASGESTPSFGPHAGLVIGFGEPTATLSLVAHGQLDLLMYEDDNLDFVFSSSLAGGAGARLRLGNGFLLEPNLGLRIFDFIHTDGASTGIGLELGLRAVARFGAKMGLLISLSAAPNLSGGRTSAIFRVGAVFRL